MECYSVLKRHEIVTHATLRMKLEDITLSKISQSQKNKCCIIPLIKMPRVFKFIETESRLVVAREGENAELLFNGNRVSVGTKKFWEWMIVIVVQQCECT